MKYKVTHRKATYDVKILDTEDGYEVYLQTEEGKQSSFKADFQDVRQNSVSAINA